MPIRRGRAVPAYLLVVALCLAGCGVGRETGTVRRATVAAAAPAPQPSRTAGPTEVPPAAPAPRSLTVISYTSAPPGLPPDPSPASAAPVTEGLHPVKRLAVYDAPGGRPRAFLPPSISGVPVTVPIVGRRTGWVAVLLPSVNRRIGWLPTTGWTPATLRDRLVLRRAAHRLTWLRDGVPHQSWTVATGAPRTPTPLGRTFVLGRTATSGAAYAGLDALVLGSVPDDKDAVAAGLRGGHTGIHAWYRAAAFGHSVSNGCIRMPGPAQRALLSHIAPGTLVQVLD
jgi:hypothetical protein